MVTPVADRRALPLQEGLVVVLLGLGFVLGFVGITHVPPGETGSAEAFAALAAAVVGIGGAEMGHATGARRGGLEHLHWRDHLAFHIALVVVVVAALIGALVLHLVEDDWSAAAATLALAALGVAVVHFVHEQRQWQGGDIVSGLILVVAGLGVGIVGILTVPSDAEAVAAVGAALVTSGGTLLGHGRGLQRAAEPGRAAVRPGST